MPGSTGAGNGSGAAEEAEEGLRIDGYLASRYRGRWRGGDDDHDLDEVLWLEIGDPAKDRVSGRLMASVLADLDGHESASSPLFSLADTYDSSLHARLFEAYADVKSSKLSALRLGRQMIWGTPELAWFDGVLVESPEWRRERIRLGAYGGVPVHLYESSPEGDAIAGLFVENRPWNGARVRLDWMHLEDERRTAEHEDDLFGLGLWQGIGRSARVEARYTNVEGSSRDVRASASWFDVDRALLVQLSHYRLLETQDALVLELDPFSETLQELFPYDQTRLLASKGFGESLDLQLGADLRRVSDEDDVGVFNHDFERYFVTGTLPKALPADLELALTLEAWESDPTDVRTWGADLSRRFGERLDLSLGSSYALYEYDALLGRERDDVRTTYLRGRWRRSERTSFEAAYEHQDDDLEDTHLVRLGTTWRF
ncbi:MAG TPA: hypothetical protein VMS76_08490 [Planctomycetota bacterium]|nr:hypothetical protein [Planctomycetota bacterium]